MPNHCENELTIDGTVETLKAIVERHIKPVTGSQSEYDQYFLDFNTIIPYPEECKEADRVLSEEKGFPHAFSQQGYDWCCENWGTKWNSYSVSYSLDGSRLYISFDTAWSPPLPVVEKFAMMYPEANFKLEFREEGMGFAGLRKYFRGRLAESGDWEIILNEDDEEAIDGEWEEIITED